MLTALEPWISTLHVEYNRQSVTHCTSRRDLASGKQEEHWHRLAKHVDVPSPSADTLTAQYTCQLALHLISLIPDIVVQCSIRQLVSAYEPLEGHSVRATLTIFFLSAKFGSSAFRGSVCPCPAAKDAFMLRDLHSKLKEVFPPL